MTSKITMCRLVFLVIAIVMAVQSTEARKRSAKPTESVVVATPQSPLRDVESKQFFADPLSRETDPPNFVRLVVMRLIYGLAVQMGFEDRLAGILNGVFVPPNADDDDYGGFESDFGEALGGGGGAEELFDF